MFSRYLLRNGIDRLGNKFGSLPSLRWSALVLATKVVVLFASIFLWHDRFFSNSVDIVAHYHLIFCLKQFWSSSAATVSCSGGLMGFYPPLTHFVALFVGLLSGSSFLGMHVLTIGAVTASYFVLAYATPRLPLLQFTISFGLLLTLLAAFRFSLALHGFEIIGNYFFAQLVSNAAFLVLLLLFCFSKLRPVLWILLAVSSVLLMGWAYSLSAVHLAIGLIACAGLREARTRLAGGRTDNRAVFSVILFAALLLACVILHPMFKLMVLNSANDGELNLAFGTDWVLPISLVLAGVGLLIAWEYTGKKAWAGSLFLASADLAVAGAAIAQVIAFWILHMGSVYAVKKHSFGLVTLLIVSTIHLLILYWLRIAPALKSRFSVSNVRGDNLAFILAGAFSVIAVAVTLSNSASRSVSDFVEIQNLARHRLLKEAPPDAVGQSVSLLPTLPEALNGVISTTDFGFPFLSALDYAYDDLPGYFDRKSTARVGPKYAFVSGDARAHGNECDIGAIDSIAAPRFVDYDCVISLPPYHFGQRLIGGDAESPFMRQGWGGKESWGFWTNGGDASLAFRLPGRSRTDLLLEADAIAFATPTHSQMVEVFANNIKVGEWSFSVSKPPTTQRLVIPAKALGNSEILTIRFHLPDAISPREVGVNEDRRVLGLGLRSVLLQINPGQSSP